MGLLYMEVSAKNNKNITELFLETVKHIPEETFVAPVAPAVVLVAAEVHSSPNFIARSDIQ